MCVVSSLLHFFLCRHNILGEYEEMNDSMGCLHSNELEWNMIMSEF